MAQSALAQIAANIHPGKWTKGESSLESLCMFHLWIDTYNQWTNICLMGVVLNDTQKWDLLVIKMAGIITFHKDSVLEVFSRRTVQPATRGTGATADSAGAGSPRN